MSQQQVVQHKLVAPVVMEVLQQEHLLARAQLEGLVELVEPEQLHMPLVLLVTIPTQ
jgi:hypothetical protein